MQYSIHHSLHRSIKLGGWWRSLDGLLQSRSVFAGFGKMKCGIIGKSCESSPKALGLVKPAIHEIHHVTWIHSRWLRFTADEHIRSLRSSIDHHPYTPQRLFIIRYRSYSLSFLESTSLVSTLRPSDITMLNSFTPTFPVCWKPRHSTGRTQVSPASAVC